jgi:methylenetetrahydrofolate dehydrogenase (NADP+)/methenyltetrahydrofolate cyclohydrolase
VKLKGKNVCIIGKSNIVGLPLSLLLQQKYDANVKVCHKETEKEDLLKSVKLAEFVIVCCGVPNLI